MSFGATGRRTEGRKCEGQSCDWLCSERWEVGRGRCVGSLRAFLCGGWVHCLVALPWKCMGVLDVNSSCDVRGVCMWLMCICADLPLVVFHVGVFLRKKKGKDCE